MWIFWYLFVGCLFAISVKKCGDYGNYLDDDFFESWFHFIVFWLVCIGCWPVFIISCVVMFIINVWEDYND